jgi:hypothetical protein
MHFMLLESLNKPRSVHIEKNVIEGQQERNQSIRLEETMLHLFASRCG